MSDPMTPERLFEIRVQRSTARACKTVDAVPVFEAVDDLLAEVTRLRPMETALAAARELHASVPCNHPDGSNGPCCSHCCYTSTDTRSSYCHNPGPCWPCPTRAALDGGA